MTTTEAGRLLTGLAVFSAAAIPVAGSDPCKELGASGADARADDDGEV